MEAVKHAWEWAKAHPIWIVGIIGVIVVFYLFSGSSSGSGGAVAGNQPTDAEVNAAAAVQAAQIAGQTQQAQYGAALEAQSNNDATGIAIAQINANSQNLATTTSGQVQEAGISAQEAVQEAGFQSQDVIALAGDALEADRISAVEAVANAPYDLAQTEITDLSNAQLKTKYYNGSALGVLLLNAENGKNSAFSIGGISASRNTPPPQSISSIVSAGGGALGSIAALIGVI